MFETCEKMFEKIEVSNLNELIINYNKNSKLHIIYVDKDDYILYLDEIIFHNITKVQAKEFIDNCTNVFQIHLQGFAVLNNIYGYPEFFSIEVK